MIPGIPSHLGTRGLLGLGQFLWALAIAVLGALIGLLFYVEES